MGKSSTKPVIVASPRISISVLLAAFITLLVGRRSWPATTLAGITVTSDPESRSAL
jgi:hypothetical protein